MKRLMLIIVMSIIIVYGTAFTKSYISAKNIENIYTSVTPDEICSKDVCNDGIYYIYGNDEQSKKINRKMISYLNKNKDIARIINYDNVDDKYKSDEDYNYAEDGFKVKSSPSLLIIENGEITNYITAKRNIEEYI